MASYQLPANGCKGGGAPRASSASHNNLLLNPPKHYTPRSSCHQGKDCEHSTLHQATNISVIVATETVNFILTDIVQVIMVALLKMLVDFLVKPVMSVIHNGCLWPVTVAFGSVYKLVVTVISSLKESYKSLIQGTRKVRLKSWNSRPLKDPCEV